MARSAARVRSPHRLRFRRRADDLIHQPLGTLEQAVAGLVQAAAEQQDAVGSVESKQLRHALDLDASRRDRERGSGTRLMLAERMCEATTGLEAVAEPPAGVRKDH